MPYGNGYVDLLSGLRRGVLLEEAEIKLARLLEEIAETGKGGTLTLTLTLKPSKGDPTRLQVTDRLAVKDPTPEVGDTLLWIADGGRLTRRDPRQPELPFAVGDEAEETEQDAIGG